MLAGYYNQYDPDKQYEKILFRSGKGLQTAELNELQSLQQAHVRGIADALFADGDVIRGGELTVDFDQASVRLRAADIYVRGHVRSVPEITLAIPLEGKVPIGLWLEEQEVTENEDKKLLNPAQETRGYQEPGAGRLQVTARWGLENQGRGDFYPVHTVINGVQRQNEPPPQLDAMTSAMARYDREANGGMYIVDGLTLSYLGTEEHLQSYSLSEGKAHVEGFEVSLPHAIRLTYPEAAELQTVASEPHRFEPAAEGSMRITLAHAPLAALIAVDVTAAKTVTLTHGGYSGAKDPLPDNAVLELVSIKQGETEYQIGNEVKLTSGAVDWSLLGNEPAPGSSYEVTYHYRTQIEVRDVDRSGFTVSGAVPGTLILVDYHWALPRIDIVTLDQHGQVRQIKGMSHPWNPPAPAVPNGQLLLATIVHNWLTGPAVSNDGVRVIPMSAMEQMQREIADLFDLVAIERLKTNAAASDPAAKKGVFVDPFLDDDLRDPGIEQSAAIIDGELMLAIDASLLDATVEHPTLLNYHLQPVLQQTARTGEMKINPYQAFEPLPARVRLTPAVDHWVIRQTRWRSGVTRSLVRGRGLRSRTTTRVRDQVVSRQAVAASTLRTRSVGYVLEGFGPNEGLQAITFDGLDVTPDTPPVANDTGRVSGFFQIPAGVPVGTKNVQFRGAGGSFGEASYTGSGTLRIEQRRRVREITTRRFDPLAQTFTLDAARHIGGCEVWFTHKGQLPVRAQIRETTVGMPNQTVLAEGHLEPEQINTQGNVTRIEWAPVWLESGREYALVLLTDDADHSVAIAELGKYSRASGWVTAQPYQVGVLLSSSNASTWTPHQEKDLAFRLLSCQFTETSREVVVGQVDAEALTDLLALADIERTGPDTDIEWIARNDDGDLRLQENQPLNLPEAIDGEYQIVARIRGSEHRSPVLYPGIQAVLGKLQDSGDYISRAVNCGGQSKITIRFEANTPGQSTVAVWCEVNGAWETATFQQAEPLGDGWEERVYQLAADTQHTRTRLVLSGQAGARPRARNLRMVVTDA